MTVILPGGIGELKANIPSSAFDPAHSSPTNGALSNGNRTFTGTSATIGSTRGTRSRSTGKYYFELHVTSIDNSTDSRIPYCGYCNTGFPVTDPSGLNPLGFDGPGTSVSINILGTNMYMTWEANTQYTDLSGVYSLPGYIGFAIDFTRGGLCVINNNYWFNGYTPSMSVGQGILVTGAVYPAVSIANTGTSVTLNTGGSPFQYGLPSGYLAWG